MNFANHKATTLVPDGVGLTAALKRTTHLGIGAHADDIEIMAWHGIKLCLDDPGAWFAAVTCTDGAASPRPGDGAALTDDEVVRVRAREQETAARLGRYGYLAQLGHTSHEVRSSPQDLESDLERLIAAGRPEVVYTHNPADKHETHVAVAVAAIAALRRLPEEARPAAVYGCEVWRSLDWMCEGEKMVLDAGGSQHLAAALVGVFDSQVGGGKRYDLATIGRRRANATFLDSHATDRYEQATYAMDLTPLIRDDPPDILEFVDRSLERFRDDVRGRLERILAVRI